MGVGGEGGIARITRGGIRPLMLNKRVRTRVLGC